MSPDEPSRRPPKVAPPSTALSIWQAVTVAEQKGAQLKLENLQLCWGDCMGGPETWKYNKAPGVWLDHEEVPLPNFTHIFSIVRQDVAWCNRLCKMAQGKRLCALETPDLLDVLHKYIGGGGSHAAPIESYTVWLQGSSKQQQLVAISVPSEPFSHTMQWAERSARAVCEAQAAAHTAGISLSTSTCQTLSSDAVPAYRSCSSASPSNVSNVLSAAHIERVEERVERRLHSHMAADRRPVADGDLSQAQGVFTDTDIVYNDSLLRVGSCLTKQMHVGYNVIGCNERGCRCPRVTFVAASTVAKIVHGEERKPFGNAMLKTRR